MITRPISSLVFSTNSLIPVVSQENGNVSRVGHGPVMIDQTVRGREDPVRGNEASGTAIFPEASTRTTKGPLSRGNFPTADDFTLVFGKFGLGGARTSLSAGGSRLKVGEDAHLATFRTQLKNSV